MEVSYSKMSGFQLQMQFWNRCICFHTKIFKIILFILNNLLFIKPFYITYHSIDIYNNFIILIVTVKTLRFTVGYAATWKKSQTFNHNHLGNFWVWISFVTLTWASSKLLKAPLSHPKWDNPEEANHWQAHPVSGPSRYFYCHWLPACTNLVKKNQMSNCNKHHCHTFKKSTLWMNTSKLT